MARRSKDEAEETREHIVEAAIKLFLKDGVSKTTLEKIAAEAGYTRGAVYHHFDNKAKLLADLMNRAHTPAQEMFDSMKLQESRDPLETLKEEMGKALNHLLTDKTSRDIHTIFIFNCEFVERGNPVYEPECKYAEAARSKVREYLEKARSLGQLRPNLDLDQVAVMIMSYGFGIISMSLRNPWHESMNMDYSEALDIFFRGLRVEAACQNAAV
jgi:TetR/AcrR family transcriptional regulator, acrAB operon repressor